MKLNFAGERVLAVAAHPDDAELLCAGTLARAREDGAVIAVCVLCRGDKGQPVRSIPNLAAVRRKESKKAARLLGSELFFCNAPDGELMDSASNRDKLVEIFRRFHVTLALAHSRADYHPDHQAAAALAEAASWLCVSRGRKTKSAPLPIPPALWWMDTLGMNGFNPGFYVDISPFEELKLKMLACHRSQLSGRERAAVSPLEALMRNQYQTRGAQAGVKAAEAFQMRDIFKRTRAW